MVGRHGFAAGETALPALSLGPFPGTTEQHPAFMCAAGRCNVAALEKKMLNLGKHGIC